MNEIESWGDMFLIDFIANAEALEHTVRPLELGGSSPQHCPRCVPEGGQGGYEVGLGLAHASFTCLIPTLGEITRPRGWGMSRRPGAGQGLDTPTSETGEDGHATWRVGGPARAGPLSSAGLGLHVRIRAPHGAFPGHSVSSGQDSDSLRHRAGRSRPLHSGAGAGPGLGSCRGGPARSRPPRWCPTLRSFCS